MDLNQYNIKKIWCYRNLNLENQTILCMRTFFFFEMVFSIELKEYFLSIPKYIHLFLDQITSPPTLFIEGVNTNK